MLPQEYSSRSYGHEQPSEWQTQLSHQTGRHRKGIHKKLRQLLLSSEPCIKPEVSMLPDGWRQQVQGREASRAVLALPA